MYAFSVCGVRVVACRSYSRNKSTKAVVGAVVLVVVVVVFFIVFTFLPFLRLLLFAVKYNKKLEIIGGGCHTALIV